MSFLYYPIIDGPVAQYNNVAVNPQYYQPRVFDISAISLGTTTTVTTTLDMDYVIGQEVRLIIPPAFGTRGLNQSLGIVIAIPSPNQVTLNINSIGNDSFIFANYYQAAQIVPVGDVNTGPINTNGRRDNITYIPGSFINISPN